MSQSRVTVNNKKLQQLIKAFKDVPKVRVGVLGGKDARNDKGPTNAEIGAAHEFGTEVLPRRSFLREPITDHLQSKMQERGAFDAEALAEVIRSGTIRPYVQKIAILCEEIVGEAFATGGFGKWQPSDMTHKKVHQTLVESQQLRNSITSEVK